MKKFIAVLGLIVGIIAILPLDFLAWWTFKETISNYTATDFINAFGYYQYADGTLEFMGPSYFFVGGMMILAFVFIVAAVWKENGAMAAIGGILMIVAPLLFLWSHSSNMNLENFTGSLAWYDGTGSDFTGDVFFGSNEFGYSWEWFLNVGFFLPFGAGIIALASAGGKK